MFRQKKKLFLILALSLIIILVTTFASSLISAQTSTPVIHSIDQLNLDDHEPDSHEGQTDRSTLELDYRSMQLLDIDELSTGTAHYPRLKKLADGTFILFYNSGRTGPNIMYITSSDLKTWSEPQTLFAADDTFKYATADAAVLDNGDILVCAAKMTDSWGSFVTDMSSSGLVTKRSTDNGKTWSSEQTVYTGMAWEPSVLQLDSGEIQIYFTHTAPYIALYGYYDELRSTGSAMIRSVNDGLTWTPNITSHNVNASDPYAAWRVMQQKIGTMTLTELATGKSVEKSMFNDQMPVAIQLNNGSIAMVVESYLHFADHPVNGGKYQLSLGFSHDNWATPLGMEEEGPADKLLNIDRAAGPYISQFPSGEVIVSHTNSSSALEYKVFDTTGHTYLRDYSFNPGVTNLWSASEVISSHKIAMVVDDGNDADSAEAATLQISLSELALNHNISAKRQKTTLDGNSADWSENTDAIFVGSLSQAQVSVRSAYDDTYVYFLVEVLDNYLSSSDRVELCISPSLTSTSSYSITVGPNGLVSKTYGYTADVSKYVNGTIGSDSNTDVGYMVEIRLSKSDLSKISFTDSMYILPKLYNVDGSTSYSYDSITGANIGVNGKNYCPKITYTEVKKYDTVYVSSTGDDNAYGNTSANAVKTLARAAQSLNDGGTIIVVNNITLSSDQHIKSTAGKVTVRGLSGNEVISCACDIYAYTSLDFDKINFKLTAANKFIYAQYNDLVIGPNVTCSKTVSTSYAIIGGYFADNAKSTYAALCSDDDCYIEINAGTWRYIRGGNRRSGTSAPLGHYSGDTTILINGGTFEATTTGLSDDVSSPTGMNSSSGNHVMIIAGGKFNGAVYAQSRSGGIETSADGYTANPEYSGSTTVILAGGTVSGTVKSSQTVGYPSAGITYTLNTKINVEYAYGLDGSVGTGFDQSVCFGGYEIPVSSVPTKIEINGKATDFRCYADKVFIPLDAASSKAIAVIYFESSSMIYIIDPASYTFEDLQMSDAFPKYIGTAIRNTASAGLRFKTSVNLELLPSNISVNKVGAIASFRSDLVSETDLSLELEKHGDSVAYDAQNLYEHWYEEKDNGEKVYTAVLVNFNSDEYKKLVTYRPYIQFEYQGDVYTLYGECVSRSVYGVAKQCTGVDSANSFIQGIISYVEGSDNDLDHSFFQ